MRKGFTLVELLAVLIILAIILLITIPIVQKTIQDSKVSSNESSIELYGRAAEQAIEMYQLINHKDPTTFSDIEGLIEYNGNRLVCNTKKINPNYTIYLTDCTVGEQDVNNYEYGYLMVKLLEDTDDSGTVSIGDKYLIKTDPQHDSYTFYVLDVIDGKVNLIMSNNICLDGSIVRNEDCTMNYSNNTCTYVDGTIYDLSLCTTPWISKEDYMSAGGLESDYSNVGNTSKGPLTAIKFLSDATKSWTNLNRINEIYKDENVWYEKINFSDLNETYPGGYESVIEGTHESGYDKITLNGFARLPKMKEILKTNCTISFETCPEWVVSMTAAPLGYWTFSSNWSSTYQQNVNSNSWAVLNDGNVDISNSNNLGIGVRPVITLDLIDFN